jgi:formate hydrogenlyase subunit 4
VNGSVGVNVSAATFATSQVLVLVVLSPLLIGLMRTVRARLEGRVGGGVLQPWRDLRK